MTAAGPRRELARYTLPSGPRALIAQRISGRVAVADLPVYHDGTVYLVARHVRSQAELDGLVAVYLADSQQRGEPAALALADLVEPAA